MGIPTVRRIAFAASIAGTSSMPQLLTRFTRAFSSSAPKANGNNIGNSVAALAIASLGMGTERVLCLANVNHVASSHA